MVQESPHRRIQVRFLFLSTYFCMSNNLFFYSPGSVLVDYFVELTDLGRKVDTMELKVLFNEALSVAPAASARSIGKSEQLRDGNKNTTKLALGSFVIDPTYTDFIGMRDKFTSYCTIISICIIVIYSCAQTCGPHSWLCRRQCIIAAVGNSCYCYRARFAIVCYYIRRYSGMYCIIYIYTIIITHGNAVFRHYLCFRHQIHVLFCLQHIV